MECVSGLCFWFIEQMLLLEGESAFIQKTSKIIKTCLSGWEHILYYRRENYDIVSHTDGKALRRVGWHHESDRSQAENLARGVLRLF